MNPQGYPAEVKYDGQSGQPGGSTVVQYTTVNISSEQPKDYIIWSLLNLLYSNPCCLGLAALIFSVKARDRKVVGDLEGARHYASTARCLNISASALVFLILICLIVTTVVAAQAKAINRN